MTDTAYLLLFLALCCPSIGIGIWIGRKVGLHEAASDPAHIDRMARKDHRIAELERSVEHLKGQRRVLAEQVRMYRDARRSAL